MGSDCCEYHTRDWTMSISANASHNDDSISIDYLVYQLIYDRGDWFCEVLTDYNVIYIGDIGLRWGLFFCPCVRVRIYWAYVFPPDLVLTAK